MRIDYMQYDKHGRPIGIPGHLMCDHGAIRDECEICRRDVLIAELRERLAAAEEAGARKMWEKSSKFCRRRSDQPPVWRCWRGTADCLDPCQFDTCPLRQDSKQTANIVKNINLNS